MTNNTRLIRLKEVEHKIGLKKSKIYDMVKKKEFPAPFRVSDQAVAWLESQVDQWIESRITKQIV